MWNSARVNLHIISHNAQGVHALVEVNSNPSFFFSAIYVSPKMHTRSILWDNLCDVASFISMPWLMLGDFNEIMWQSEKWGGRPIN